MGILARFSSIMSANINALLDKCEDPEKMVDQYLRDAINDLAVVKKETAAVMAAEAAAKRALEANRADVAKYTNLAKNALQAGNEGDARKFLAKKQEIEANTGSLQRSFDTARANADRMRELHDKLVNDINSLKARRENVKATMAVAKTQETINKMGETSEKINGSLGAFARMEEKATKMLDSANAVAELNAGADDSLENLETKYGAGSSASVDSELDKLKAEMGLA